ncbi:TlpA family protein disulfide reductase [Haloimpatiens sp. FM7330]|uniref:TlpA family protein disulfide reductase n=1 Tax=Haloimpatiens sp. FM7330 TaxID=3298610 RepID=UPI0036448533
MKKIFLIISICVILSTSIKACSTVSKKNTTNSNNKIGEKIKDNKSKDSEEGISFDTMKSIPKFKCKDTNGKGVTNEIFKDKKLTLINFWGTW